MRHSKIKQTNLFMLLTMVYMIAAGVLFVSFIDTLDSLGYFLPNPAIIVLTGILLQIIPFAFYLFVTREKLTEVIPLKNPGIVNIVLIVLMAAFIQPFAGLLGVITSFFFENPVAETVSDMNPEKVGALGAMLGLLAISVTPAICEEAVYRGVVYHGYKNAPLAVKAIISGLFFALMHMAPQQFLYTFFLGVVFALVLHYSGSFFSAVAFHFSFNAVSVGINFGLSALLSRIPETITEDSADIVEEIVDDIAANPNAEWIGAIIAFIFYAMIVAVFTGIFALFFWLFILHNKSRNAASAENIAAEGAEVEKLEAEPFSFRSVFSPSFFGVIVFYLLITIILAS